MNFSHGFTFFKINFLVPYLGQRFIHIFQQKSFSPNKVGIKFQLPGYPSITLFLWVYFSTLHTSLIFIGFTPFFSFLAL